jgi:hypothetical protein
LIPQHRKALPGLAKPLYGQKLYRGFESPLSASKSLLSDKNYS